MENSVRRGGFLALTVRGKYLPGAADAVAAAFPVARVDLGALFLTELRALAEEQHQPWEKVLGIDARYAAGGRISKGLAAYARASWQRVDARLAARAATAHTVLFVHDAGLLARYWDEGGRDLLVALQAAARRPAVDPHGLWLLTPVETRGQQPHLDGRTVECIGDAERTYLDGAFLESLTV